MSAKLPRQPKKRGPAYTISHNTKTLERRMQFLATSLQNGVHVAQEAYYLAERAALRWALAEISDGLELKKMVMELLEMDPESNEAVGLRLDIHALLTANRAEEAQKGSR